MLRKIRLTIRYSKITKAIVQRTGEVNEEPPGHRITDVPLTAFCRGIERDAREMLGERDLPPKPEPKDGYLR